MGQMVDLVVKRGLEEWAQDSIDAARVLCIPDITPLEHTLTVGGCLDPMNIILGLGLLWEHGVERIKIVVPPYRLKDIWGWGNEVPMPVSLLSCDQWSGGTFRGVFAGCPIHSLQALNRDICVVFADDDTIPIVPEWTVKICVA